MTEAVLIFTFSPIQSFIAEARRAEDLFNGSAILSELARAAAAKLGESNLIYPAPPLAGDVPNILVARLPAGQVGGLAVEARIALYDRWRTIAEQARDAMRLPQDDIWQKIWQRQVSPENIWGVYWAAAPIGADGYSAAYRQARRSLDGVKRSRLFAQSTERGQKDSLSGNREALRTADYFKARDYWSHVAGLPGINPSKIRPNGRERLDTIGAVKRFYEHPEKSRFYSTSSVAASEFLAVAIEKAKESLEQYAQELRTLMGDKLYRVRDDPHWPYDGDFLYLDTLTPERLKEDYRLKSLDEDQLDTCREKLGALYRACDARPSTYYAVVALDGDHMGITIDDLLNGDSPQEAHRSFSRQIAAFSTQVPEILREYGGFRVYNGGDDVLFMAPLSRALPLTQNLALVFEEKRGDPSQGEHGAAISLPKTTASAGIAITHHHSPLDFALEEARRAERSAKNDAGRAAVCVRLLRRSGEPLTARSKWDDISNVFSDLLALFLEGALSSRLAYAVQRDSPVLTGLDTDARQSALKFLLRRQSEEGFQEADAWAEKLSAWASKLDGYLALETSGVCDEIQQQGLSKQGMTEVGNWLVLARFLALGGGE